MKILRFLTICMLAVVIGGCACGNRISIDKTRTSTVGSDLIELQKAKDSGAITDKEYKIRRRELLEILNEPDVVHLMGENK